MDVIREVEVAGNQGEGQKGGIGLESKGMIGW